MKQVRKSFNQAIMSVVFPGSVIDQFCSCHFSFCCSTPIFDIHQLIDIIGTMITFFKRGNSGPRRWHEFRVETKLQDVSFVAVRTKTLASGRKQNCF